jgi:hypothetical protein
VCFDRLHRSTLGHTRSGPTLTFVDSGNVTIAKSDVHTLVKNDLTATVSVSDFPTLSILDHGPTVAIRD